MILQKMDTVSCEMFILGINNFLNLDQHENFGSFRFLAHFCIFLSIKRLDVFQLRQNIVNYLLSTREDIYSYAK